MAQQLTALGFPYYEGTDSPAGQSQQQALAAAVDAQPGVGNSGGSISRSLSRVD